MNRVILGIVLMVSNSILMFSLSQMTDTIGIVSVENTVKGLIKWTAISSAVAIPVIVLTMVLHWEDHLQESDDVDQTLQPNGGEK